MADTNMDINKNPKATVPVFEFRVPISEVDMVLEVGDLGKLVVPVEVISKADGTYTFRKTEAVEADGNFRPEDLSDVRKRLLKKHDDSED